MIPMNFMPCSSTVQILKEENVSRIVCSFIIPRNPDNYITEMLNINIFLNKLEIYLFQTQQYENRANTKVTYSFFLQNVIWKPNVASLFKDLHA